MEEGLFTRVEKFVLEVARYAHGDQRRKYTGEPYINHVIQVAHLVREYGGNTCMICAALLHDVIEDTYMREKELRKILEATELTDQEVNEIISLVIELTDVFTTELYPEFNRRERKALEVQRLGKISADAQTIKLCDLIDNSSSITEFGGGFAKIYLQEKKEILKVMTKGNKSLHERASFAGKVN